MLSLFEASHAMVESYPRVLKGGVCIPTGNILVRLDCQAWTVTMVNLGRQKEPLLECINIIAETSLQIISLY